jgi:excisionase family DNA binding protein
MNRVPPEQLDFPSLAFPRDRKMLYVHEVAERLSVTQQHVIDLIDEGKIRAINVAGDNPTNRKYYRIPVEAWQRFIVERTL